MPGKPSSAVEDWRHIARGSDLLYDICSWPDKRGSWTEEEFYAAGVSDWEDFRRHWEHYAPELAGTCVEVGCGAGRITAQLGRSFERVVALDVSVDMIERARQVAPGNVTFEQVEGTAIPLGDDEADAVFSVHVMQHLETVEMLRAYINEMHRVLRAGGTLMVHILLRGAPESGPRARLEQIRAEWALWQSRRALRRGGQHTTMRTRAYWLNDVWQMLTDAGFRDVELRMIPVRSNGYGHQFWFGRAS